MTYTYNFYRKAEQKNPDTKQSFEGASEQDVKEAVHEYCDIYGFEAYTLVQREWSQDEIRKLIQTNDKVLYGALKKLYAEQTADEQRSGETKIHNGVGFNGADSRFLSSVSEFLIRRGFLTDKQKLAVRKKLVKYAGQLTRLANA